MTTVKIDGRSQNLIQTKGILPVLLTCLAFPIGILRAIQVSAYVLTKMFNLELATRALALGTARKIGEYWVLIFCDKLMYEHSSKQ